MAVSFADIQKAVDNKDLFYTRDNMSQLLYPTGFSRITLRDRSSNEDVISFDENTFNASMSGKYFKSDTTRGGRRKARRGVKKSRKARKSRSRKSRKTRR